MRKLKIMSFNMRTQGEWDGVNQFRMRKDRIMEMLTREDADIIGFQEVTDEMRHWLREALGGKYTVVGCGRMSDYTGEAVAIALRNGLFELVALTPFWLSDTPGQVHRDRRALLLYQHPSRSYGKESTLSRYEADR